MSLLSMNFNEYSPSDLMIVVGSFAVVAPISEATAAQER